MKTISVKSYVILMQTYWRNKKRQDKIFIMVFLISIFLGSSISIALIEVVQNLLSLM